jgi:hypothetical protein
LNNKNFLSSNILLNRIIEKHNASHPPMDITARNFYTHLNLMTIKWARSLSQRKWFIILYYLDKNFRFRRQMHRFLHCFYGYNSHFNTYLWSFNRKINDKIFYFFNLEIFSSRIKHPILSHIFWLKFSMWSFPLYQC